METYTTYTNYESSTVAEAGLGMAWIIAIVGVWAFAIIAFWRVFTKAGKPGWASIVPIYNLYIALKIIGKPGWWVLLYFIPLVNLIVHIIVAVETAKAFGKSTTFGIVGLWLFSLIGYAILGYGNATYRQPQLRA